MLSSHRHKSFVVITFISLYWGQVYGNLLRTFFTLSASIYPQITDLVNALPRDALLVGLQVILQLHGDL
jgi:hypothetical protein